MKRDCNVLPSSRSTETMPPLSPPGSGDSAERQTPARNAQPAALLRNRLVTVEARDALPTALFQGRRQSSLRYRIAGALARDDCDRRNPAGQKLPGCPLDPEHGAASLDGSGRIVAPEALVGAERKDQPPAILQAVEPGIRRPGCARIHVDDIGWREGNGAAIAVHDADIGPRRQI